MANHRIAESPAWRHIGRALRSIIAEADALERERFSGDPRPGSVEEGWKDEGYRRGLLAAVSDIEEGAKGPHLRAVETWIGRLLEAERAKMRRREALLRVRAKLPRDPEGCRSDLWEYERLARRGWYFQNLRASLARGDVDDARYWREVMHRDDRHLPLGLPGPKARLP